MTTNPNIFEDLSLIGSLDSTALESKYRNFGLRFNPFPKSGTTNINGSDSLYSSLFPVDTNVYKEVLNFIKDSIIFNPLEQKDRFICATITGDYGTGKTQLLMYIKYVLTNLSSNNKINVRPFVVYVDNPGAKLSELIGSIISKIGEENFKKFVWEKIINKIKETDKLKLKLDPFVFKGSVLFHDVNNDPYHNDNITSYKKFLDSFVRYQNAAKSKRKEFELIFREVILESLSYETNNSIISQYLYEIISEDFGVNKTWEDLSSGSIKQLDRKEAEIIKFIVKLIKDQGYTDFFILVDEFEDVTAGRLSKVQIDNYVYNLRTLLDEHRDWCLMFAMTSEALKKLRSVSPPLADRITIRQILLESLTDEHAELLIKRHLDIAKSEESIKESIIPFTKESIIYLNEKVNGNPRILLRNCYQALERFVSQINDTKTTMDVEFLKENSL